MDALRLMTGTPTRNYEEIERLLSCPICLEVFNKPVVILPCQHNLCRKCANDVFQNRGTPMGSGGRFRCPTCRYEVVLDRHGVYGLQRNLLVENIIDMYQTEGRKPIFKTVETLMCQDHEDEKVNIYCLTCQKPTCSLCKVFGQHQDCDVSPMEKVYKDQKKEISDAIAMLVSGNDRLQAIITQTEELGKMTDVNGRKIKSDLCAAFDKLYAILEDKKNSMIAKITSDVQERNQVLQEMLKNYGQQLEGASKLMEASLTLLEERSIPQFLSLSREMIEKVQNTARSSEVRKPPFNIQNMEEFYVCFKSQELMLKDLDFGVLKEEECESNTALGDETETREITADSDIDEDCEVNVEDDVNESDDTAATSVASRSDVGSFSSARISTSGISHSRDQSISRLNEGNSGTPPNENETTYRPNDETTSTAIKKGRWYDMFVRQLPSPISMAGFSAPMESSVHMKVTLPLVTDEEDEDLKKPQNSSENASSFDEEEDAEIEELLAPRTRKWISSISFLSSPEGSLDASPRTSPSSLQKYRRSSQVKSPTNHLYSQHSLRLRQRPRRMRDCPQLHSVSESASLSPSFSFQRQSRSRNDSPTGSTTLSSQRESPTPGSFIRNQHRRRSNSPRTTNNSTSNPTQNVGQRLQVQGETTSHQRRPRGYCTHRRRTWSHLLDKK